VAQGGTGRYKDVQGGTGSDEQEQRRTERYMKGGTGGYREEQRRTDRNREVQGRMNREEQGQRRT
jgi:hypothetical protein